MELQFPSRQLDSNKQSFLYRIKRDRNNCYEKFYSAEKHQNLDNWDFIFFFASENVSDLDLGGFDASGSRRMQISTRKTAAVL